MYKGHPFANKVLHRMQLEKLLETHRQNLKQVRPNTEFLQTRQHFITLNPKKKQMIRESKFTQIQRQNRLLLQKITSIMSKKRSNSQNKMNKSLNTTFRRKQSQTIQVQNAKMLRRLQQRKSDYELSKYKKQWSKTKKMIKNITSYPIVIDNIASKKKKKQSIIQYEDLKHVANTNPQDFQLVKLRLINTKRFVVTVKFTAEKFIIIGDLKAEKQLKVIQIGKEEALRFIEQKCMGDINKLFDFLRYDQTEKSLYLLADMQEDSVKNDYQPQSRIKLRQKKLMKPIQQEIQENILQHQDLIF